MATRALARSPQTIVIRQPSKPARRSRRRRGSSPITRKRLAKLRRRTQSAGLDTTQTLVTIGTPAALTWLSANKGINLPSVAGLPAFLVWGAAAALLAPEFLSGRDARLVQSAGLGLAAVGATEAAAAGSLFAGGGRGARVAGDEIAGDEIAGDYEIGDDEVGDDEVGDDEVGDDDFA